MLPDFQRCSLSAIALAVAVLSGGLQTAQSGISPIGVSDFAPNAQVITFETGTTALPQIPGVTFLSSAPSSTMPWYGSSGNFEGFFGIQGWSNTVSSTYGDLGLQFTTPVQAIGGYVGWIPNFTMQNPSTVFVELFNASLMSLGTAQVTLTPAFNSPIFFGFTASEPIARFRMTSNNAGFFNVDNFTYGAVVPELSAVAYLAIAAVLIVPLQASRRQMRARCTKQAGA